MLPLAVISTLLSSFLLFQIQPMMARLILPTFGGAPTVWTTCLVLYQVMLCAGYLYAYLSRKFLPWRMHLFLHALLVLIAFLWALEPLPAIYPPALESPFSSLATSVLLGIGLPFILLSSNSPLMQAWSFVSGVKTPYWLYALSNAASLGGLLGYPFIIEPLLGSSDQFVVWWTLFVVWGIVTLIFSRRLLNQRNASVVDEPTSILTITWRPLLLWLGTSALGVMLLQSTSLHIGQDIAAVPLLWVVPLALYLTSLIVVFRSSYEFRPLLWLTLLFISWLPFAFPEQMPSAIIEIAAANLGLFAACMLVHGVLSSSKPEPHHLPLFFVLVSLGGALGGVAISLGAPLVFDGIVEHKLTLLMTVVLLFGVRLSRHDNRIGRCVRHPLGITALVSIVLLATPILSQNQRVEGEIFAQRNFFGVLRVRETVISGEPSRGFYHGRVLHGQQLTAPGLERTPVAYYTPLSGVGKVFGSRHLLGEQLHIGVVGLGIGTLVAFLEPGDSARTYELDPDVVSVAQTHFSYLASARGPVEIVVGDARRSLETEVNNGFDLLFLDAFSGDGIPIHLLTREAFSVYRRHLAPQGVIVAQISNLFFDLMPVLAAAARDLNMELISFKTPDSEEHFATPAYHGILLPADHPLIPALLASGGTRYDGHSVPWSDDFHSLLPVLGAP